MVGVASARGIREPHVKAVYINRGPRDTGCMSVFRPKPHAIEAIFARRKAVIGVIHLQALPGAPAYDGAPMEDLIDFAVAEAGRYRAGGVDGLIVENHGDIPFAKPEALGPETAAAMAVITRAVRLASGLPVGVNVLANGAVQAFAVAKVAGAAFIRVNQWANAYVANEGFIEGRAGEAMRYRAMLHGRDIRVFADVHVKHGAHAIVADRSIPEMARDAEFFDADAVIATGQRTGDSATMEELTAIAKGIALPVLVGSGVTPANIGDIFTVADAVIIASWLKQDGVWWNQVDPDRVAAFMREADRGRAAK
jgi:membrane complex biogenesis BtpA family protein